MSSSSSFYSPRASFQSLLADIESARKEVGAEEHRQAKLAAARERDVTFYVRKKPRERLVELKEYAIAKQSMLSKGKVARICSAGVAVVFRSVGKSQDARAVREEAEASPEQRQQWQQTIDNYEKTYGEVPLQELRGTRRQASVVELVDKMIAAHDAEDAARNAPTRHGVALKFLEEQAGEQVAHALNIPVPEDPAKLLEDPDTVDRALAALEVQTRAALKSQGAERDRTRRAIDQGRPEQSPGRRSSRGDGMSLG